MAGTSGTAKTATEAAEGSGAKIALNDGVVDAVEEGVGEARSEAEERRRMLVLMGHGMPRIRKARCRYDHATLGGECGW